MDKQELEKIITIAVEEIINQSPDDGNRMKAYVIDEARKMQVVEVPQPVPTEDNIIVSINYASICGTDFRTFMKGNEKITPPRVLGHEAAGVIIHAGIYAKGKGFQVGDRVTVAPAIGCGECWPCKTGHTNMCNSLKTIGFQYEGAFAEKMEIPKQAIKMGNVIKIPEAVSDMSAVLAEPAACALNAQRYLNIGEDDYVLIYGSGYIGCVHAELAKIAGAKKVIMVEIAEPRARIAKEMIPDITIINPKEQNTVAEVMKLTNGRGANVVITALSVPSVHTEALEVASKMGRISLFGGIAGDGKGYLDSNLIHYKELSVHGVHATTADLMREIIENVASGRMNLEKYVTKVFPLNQIEEGFRCIRDENAMKILISP